MNRVKRQLLAMHAGRRAAQTAPLRAAPVKKRRRFIARRNAAAGGRLNETKKQQRAPMRLANRATEEGSKGRRRAADSYIPGYGAASTVAAGPWDDTETCVKIPRVASWHVGERGSVRYIYGNPILIPNSNLHPRYCISLNALRKWFVSLYHLVLSELFHK